MISSINPSIKAFAILVPGILLSLTFDMFTPLIYLLFVLVVTFGFSDVSFKRWMKIFAPFLLVALGFAWMTMLYTSDSFSGGRVLFEIWMFEVTTGAVMVGISLALRSLCFVALSLLFVLTTDSTKFMLSLMQQCKLPPKITYGVLAGYRFLPTFQNELQILRQAHRIRGVGRERGIRDKLNQFRRYSVPLLANGIRKSERVAIAMESKGFKGDVNRTHYHKMTVRKKDWIFLSVMIGSLFLVGFLSYCLGYLNIFGKTF
ncbi:energy-coupling factor transporter transmembrane protein EcfT [Ornithinibacillus sp. L9]|uniref:Energy-coupling factor transporter transmembrane protein EcfT n=1 Tax=Ornithinibacillus caprae TaxID=2678566 RepID=A0A6N8FNW1_9BACI|nr:energy-coupling factor transporter transmembrane component T [Ornithinibacillus caprae]MUK90546.1 energy-coupling factor transporter transmembrane protein EcfT [Ornithinibacillus caprae]